MTTYERMKRMYEHKEADRIPIVDVLWNSTRERWQEQGMPAGVDLSEYFDIDSIPKIEVDNSFRFEVKILKETEEYIIHTTPWGSTFKDWKHKGSTPEAIDYKIISPDEWYKAKERMIPSQDRVDWDFLKANYKRWREQGYWVRGRLFFGFDVAHTYAVGTERFLIALIEEPEWCVDMFNHYLDVSLALQDLVWDAGYEFDEISWDDDLAYKLTQFFSVKTYRELLKPVHKRAIEWGHKKGIKTHMHSCGEISPFIPEFIDIGLDGINPLEVKSGLDPVELKKKYGKDILFRGGNNAMLWDSYEMAESEMKKIVPAMKESGGYIFASDHSIPDSVKLDTYRKIVALAKKLGRY
ncbi:MAG: uroporphyrinogen decarboxylase family protein [Candidatus Humimicrobiaceae bacterium]